MPERVLVTGASGFAGSHLVEALLADGAEVRGFGQTADWCPGAEHLAARVPLFAGDVADPAAVAAAFAAGPYDAVYHLAGFASVADSAGQSETVWRANRDGTRTVFEAVARHCPAARTLLVSSGLVYGQAEGPFREDGPVAPASDYARSKLAAEELAAAFVRERGLRIAVARSFNHTGPRQRGRFVLVEWANHVAAHEDDPAPPPLRCGNVELLRDFTDVRDVAQAYRGIVRVAAPGEVFNVASGQPRLLRELRDRLLAAARRPIPVAADPARFRAHDPPAIRVDVAKLETRAGWHAATPLERSMDDLLEYCRWLRRR